MPQTPHGHAHRLEVWICPRRPQKPSESIVSAKLEEPHKVSANWQDYGLVFASSKGIPPTTAATDPSPPATASDSAPLSAASRAASVAFSPGSSTRTRIPRSRAALVRLSSRAAAFPAARLRIRSAEAPLASTTDVIFLVWCFGLLRMASHW